MIDNKEKERIKAQLREIVRNGCIVTTNHFRERMAERGVVLDDVTFVISWGEVTKKKYDPMFENYEYTIKGVDIDDEEISLILAIDKQGDSIYLITVC
jgi:uncharacterized OsmC-like protein